jgi:hypothetical protein
MPDPGELLRQTVYVELYSARLSPRLRKDRMEVPDLHGLQLELGA